MHLVANVYLQKTLTNMLGAAANTWFDVYGAAFEPDNNVIDFDGATQFRIVWEYNYTASTGTHTVRWVNQANNAEVLYTSSTFTAVQDGTDTGWQALPAAFTGSVVKTIEWQARGTNTTDDPQARGFRIFLK